ncbi:MAG: hypothetical protein A2845_02915 [Candidatus Lloydbacteria bacterium RIFCSPHIGHO2_01_FULL_49_22]|uniref:Uncharacterized protein n=1 Tax=Candidatus Lloydbacteria bacterium RIFCSPHIGHO2_01_FULL_49_22 TaxID=1798658 RepID=A0A1G2CX16_9BACT|nr:MAG: hypothetical protein A2845_02915 [Candidatus Lloydbacteria bacterium RIFCSPHIGHO2_01_FULL_49_22]OGZ10392.1 MAG: hypothetical protein A3C14_02615 [Candidatus Lloydbacteria bacterium RIFCSPHIGHO2_02_FULL_50_18]
MTISESTLDKVGAMGAAFSLIDLIRGFSHGGVHVGGGTGGVGFLTSLLTVLVRVWEEKGGSMKDESEMLESMFANPQAKNEKLTPQERTKIAAVIKAMTPAEQKVFRIAIFVMDPDVTTIEVPEKKDKDGKVIAVAGKRTEKTGIDPRVNVLHGIAEHVHDNLDNVTEVAELLRGTGALGGNNEALKFLVKVQVELKKLLCTFFGVESVDLITFDMVKEKATVLIGNIGVPNANLPGPPVGPLMRVGRLITPGSYRNAPASKSVKSKKEVRSTSLLKMFAVVACITGILAYGLYFGASKYRAYQRDTEIDNIINAYQPTKTSAEQPMK